ncbi:NINE protein [Paenibacillus oenotherae]|uniref:NINE protein n=1 Tax=Paenibacillus oenotherae TaxID=1435645 RepID=A0ABS7DAA8_9BACL|nr:NINE protein [Paenibacillus oenotherae]MBW7476526.1 NINE protein [Paenibacillus oenotherae]
MLNRYDLTLNELMIFNSEMKSAEKSAGIAYLMLLGGHLGLHRFYLKRKGSAFGQLAVFAVAILTYIFFAVAAELESDAFLAVSMVLFFLSALALFIWVIVDLFLLPGMIQEYNKVVERNILDQIEHHRRMEQLSGRGAVNLNKPTSSE